MTFLFNQKQIRLGVRFFVRIFLRKYQQPKKWNEKKNSLELWTLKKLRARSIKTQKFRSNQPTALSYCLVGHDWDFTMPLSSHKFVVILILSRSNLTHDFSRKRTILPYNSGHWSVKKSKLFNNNKKIVLIKK